MRRVFLPRSLEELWEILDREEAAALYAGGTDLLVKLRRGLIHAPWLVCLERLDELRGVREEGENVVVGACTTHAQILRHATIREHFPVLAQALGSLGSPPIRAMGTIGGNICSASPAADTLPPLYVLEADLDLLSASGSRRVPLKDFILSPGKTDLRQGEILGRIRIRKNADYNVHHFEKLGRRKALAIAVVSLAALLSVSDAGIIAKASLAWGSVGPTVVRSQAVEAALIGNALKEKTLRSAAALARDAVLPISDIRASETYRRAVAGELLLRLIANGVRGHSPDASLSP